MTGPGGYTEDPAGAFALQQDLMKTHGRAAALADEYGRACQLMGDMHRHLALWVGKADWDEADPIMEVVATWKELTRALEAFGIRRPE